MATAFWNLFGAGVLGFLINLPFVSYFQHGSFLTAAHGHGALMGVYGMLAIALALFSLRNIVEPKLLEGKWLMSGFWGLNIGLMGMIVVTLVPIGVMQALESFKNGFWSARSLDFYQQPLVNTLLWLRMVPDSDLHRARRPAAGGRRGVRPVPHAVGARVRDGNHRDPARC